MGYGFDKRPDMPDRFIKGTPQGQPRNQWPRKVRDKMNEEAASAFRQIQQVMQCDGTALFGQTVGGVTSGTTGGGGVGSSTTATDEFWFSAIGRFCRHVELVHAGVGGARWKRDGLRLNMSPLAWLDPDEPYVPCIWRFEDVMAARLITPDATHDGAMHFGITWENAAGPALTPNGFVGIYASWSGTAYGTWTARCVDDSGTGLNQSLGITTQLPHRLLLEIDGATKTVRFYIDGALLHEYAPTGSDLALHSSGIEIDFRWNTMTNDGGTLHAGYLIDCQPIMSVEVVDEAA